MNVVTKNKYSLLILFLGLVFSRPVSSMRQLNFAQWLTEVSLEMSAEYLAEINLEGMKSSSIEENISMGNLFRVDSFGLNYTYLSGKEPHKNVPVNYSLSKRTVLDFMMTKDEIALFFIC